MPWPMRGMKPIEEEDELAGLMDLEREAIEQGALGSNLPVGTKVEFAPDSAMQPESAAERMPIVPKVVQVPGGMDDVELAAAQLEDRRARAREAFERGGRQMVAGLTRTQEQPIFQQGKDAVARLLAKRKDAAAQAQLAEQNRLGAAKLNYDKEQDRQRTETRSAERTQDLAEREKDNLRAERQIESRDKNTAAMMGLRFDEANTKKKAEADKDASGTVPFVGGTFTMSKGLTDGERAKARDYASSWNTAISNVDGVRGALDQYLQSPSLETKGAVESQLVGALTALNVAYKQGAMADTEARRLSEAMGVDLTSKEGLAAAVSSWLTGDPGAAGRVLRSKIETLRQASKKAAMQSMSTYGTFSDGETGDATTLASPARPTATNPKTKEKVEWNGSEWVPVKGG